MFWGQYAQGSVGQTESGVGQYFEVSGITLLASGAGSGKGGRRGGKGLGGRRGKILVGRTKLGDLVEV